MPHKHRYKCLNFKSCPGYNKPVNTTTDKNPLFIAMNSPQPTCPHCGSIKLEDWGPAMNPMIGGQGGAKQLDADMRSMAESFGMTDMSNKGGKAVKGSAGEAKGEYAQIQLPGGVMAPVDYTPKCSNVALTSTPLKLQAGAAFAGKPPTQRSVPTNIVAEHKGAA